MKKQKRILLAGVLLLLLLAGCSEKQEKRVKGPFLFYISVDETGLKREEYAIKEKEPEKAVEKMIEKLSESPKPVEMKAVLTEETNVERFELQDNVLHLFMSQGYYDLNEVEEVLVRASLVQSFTQIPGVEYVDMNVGDKPVLSNSGEEIGLMQADSFVRNTGTALKSFQRSTLTLFYANESGEKLVPEKVDVHYFGNTSTETLVVEQLMKGPESQELKSIIPSKVKLLSTSVKDGICYINFDKQFLEAAYDVKPEVVIYGITNSLITNGSVNRVQILVEGESTKKFQESISLGEPFEHNVELVEQE